VAEVIEGEDAIKEHEDAVGDVEVVFGVVAYVLQLADYVVGAIANGSGGEGREALDLGGTVLVEEFLDDLENIGGTGFDFGDAGGVGARLALRRFGIAVDGDLVAARLEAEEGADT